MFLHDANRFEIYKDLWQQDKCCENGWISETNTVACICIYFSKVMYKNHSESAI